MSPLLGSRRVGKQCCTSTLKSMEPSSTQPSTPCGALGWLGACGRSSLCGLRRMFIRRTGPRTRARGRCHAGSLRLSGWSVERRNKDPLSCMQSVSIPFSTLWGRRCGRGVRGGAYVHPCSQAGRTLFLTPLYLEIFSKRHQSSISAGLPLQPGCPSRSASVAHYVARTRG